MSILKTTLGGISSLTVECVGDEARFRWRSFPIRCVVKANEFRGTVHFRNDALGGFASVPSKVWFLIHSPHEKFDRAVVYSNHLNCQHRLQVGLWLDLLQHMEGSLQMFCSSSSAPCMHCSGLYNENGGCFSVGNPLACCASSPRAALASNSYCPLENAVCRRGVLGLGAAFFC